jgi:hypothetical protein
MLVVAVRGCTQPEVKEITLVVLAAAALGVETVVKDKTEATTELAVVAEHILTPMVAEVTKEL